MAKQAFFEGTEPPHYDALDDLATVYHERMTERAALSKAEAEAHKALLEKMIELEVETYRWEDGDQAYVLRVKTGTAKVRFEPVRGEE